MSYNKFLLLGAGVLLSTITSSNAYAVNCSISYYCYRSMTPGPAPESNAALVRRTTAASNRVAANARRAQAQRTRTNAGAGQQQPQQRRAVPLTLEQRQAEARRREQQQQRELAQRRQRAAQQAQQRLAAQRQRQAQAAQNQQRQQINRNPNQTAAQRSAAQQQLIAAQRRAYQARLEQQRRAQQQQANNRQTAASQPTPRPVVPVVASSTQSCAVITKKINELNRQAVLRSKEKQYDQSQRLFKAVDQLKKEGRNRQCPGIT